MQRHNCSNVHGESHGIASVGPSNSAYSVPETQQEIVYIGQRTADGCTVKRRGEIRPISPRLDLRMHSPTGFEWGFAGSGPSQTALAILADFLDDDRRALRLYQNFKWALISGLPQEGWELTGEQIAAVIERLERGDV